MALNLRKKWDDSKITPAGASAADPAAERRPANPRAVEMVENEAMLELRGQLEEAREKQVQHIDPKLARPSAFMNRHPTTFETEDFRELVADIRDSGGNTVPAVVRRIDDPKFEFEIIAGLRRHRAALESGTLFKVLIEQVDDRRAFETMTRENAKRKDLAPWEWGRHYDLGLKMYASQKELAVANGMSDTHVSNALAVFRLPAEVVSAFASPREIQFGWGRSLSKAVEEAGDRVLKVAREVGSAAPRPDANAVLRALLDAGRPVRGRPRKKAEEGVRRTIQVGKTKGTLWTKDGKTGLELRTTLAAEKFDQLERFIQRLLA